MRRFIDVFAFVFVLLSWPSAGFATPARLDAETCNQLRLEQIKFKQLGVVSDIEKGGTWGKANLSAERLREIEQYIQLDEQVKFGCRDAKLTIDAERASEAARRLELNSDLDPTAPLPASSEPGSLGAASADANGSSDDGASDVTPETKPVTKPVVKSDRPAKPAAAKPKPAAAKLKPPKADDAYSQPAGSETVLVPPKGTPAWTP